MNRLRSIFAGAALGLLSVWGRSAFADGGDRVAAETLFDEGRKLLADGKYAEACPKFAESQRLDPALGTMLNLADCLERNGQTASAWEAFRDAQADAHKAGDAKREAVAQKRAKALEPRLARLTIQVSASADMRGLEIRRDAVLFGRPAWGVATPIDPGRHTIEAKAPGKKTWTTTITVDAKGSGAVVTIPVLDDGSGEATGPAAALPTRAAGAEPTAPRSPEGGAAASPSAAAPSSDASESGSSGSGQRIAGIVIAGAGVVGVGIGAVFGLLANSANQDSASHCNGNDCDQQGVDLRDSALGRATVSTVAFAVGGAALVGGAVVFLTAPHAKTGRGLRAPAVAVGPSSAVLRGSFQ